MIRVPQRLATTDLDPHLSQQPGGGGDEDEPGQDVEGQPEDPGARDQHPPQAHPEAGVEGGGREKEEENVKLMLS